MGALLLRCLDAAAAPRRKWTKYTSRSLESGMAEWPARSQDLARGGRRGPSAPGIARKHPWVIGRWFGQSSVSANSLKLPSTNMFEWK